jgi:hypothetical protein
MLYKTNYFADVEKCNNLNLVEQKAVINQPTGNFFYDPWEIKEAYKNTMWAELLSTLPTSHGEARIIVMKPGTTYMAHSDIDDRWHLNLQGEESYLIDLDNLDMHKLEKDGHWYSMDAGKKHVASNFGSVDRVQLVVRQLLTKTDETDLVRVTITPRNETHDYRFQFDKYVSPWLNKTNKQGLMTDFNNDGTTVSFKVSASAVSNLKYLKLSDYFEVTAS